MYVSFNPYGEFYTNYILSTGRLQSNKVKRIGKDGTCTYTHGHSHVSKYVYGCMCEEKTVKGVHKRVYSTIYGHTIST